MHVLQPNLAPAHAWLELACSGTRLVLLANLCPGAWRPASRLASCPPLDLTPGPSPHDKSSKFLSCTWNCWLVCRTPLGLLHGLAFKLGLLAQIESPESLVHVGHTAFFWCMWAGACFGTWAASGPKACPGTWAAGGPKACSGTQWQAKGLLQRVAGARSAPAQHPLEQGKFCF